jgi:hypothetical protein
MMVDVLMVDGDVWMLLVKCRATGRGDSIIIYNFGCERKDREKRAKTAHRRITDRQV